MEEFKRISKSAQKSRNVGFQICNPKKVGIPRDM